MRKEISQKRFSKRGLRTPNKISVLERLDSSQKWPIFSWASFRPEVKFIVSLR